MVIEKVLFNLLAFTLFLILFLKIVQKNDTSYILILAIEFVGIFINFIELITDIEWNLTIRILMYLLAVVIPIIVLWLEKIGYEFSELSHLAFAKYWLFIKKEEKAKQVLLNLVEKYPNSYQAHKWLAHIYEKQEKWDIAMDEYTRAIDLRSSDKDSYFKVAEISNRIGKNEVAIDMLYHLLKQKPEEYRATELLGNILQDEGRYKEAISIYQEALRYHPTEYEIYYQLGMAYTMLNDFQKAKEYYEKAADLNSMLFHAKYDIGQIALIMGDLEDAKQYFMECIQNGDTEVGGYYYLALLSVLKGDLDQAIQYMNLAIELDGEDGTVYQKMLEEEVFVKIRNKVNKPTSQEKKERKITKREKETQKHLEEMYSLVGKLNHTDLEMMKNTKAQEKEKESIEMEKDDPEKEF